MSNMTYIAGPFIATKSTPVINDQPQEHVIRMRVVNRAPQHNMLVPMRASLFVVAIVTLAMLLITGLILVVVTDGVSNSDMYRFRGFCSIPIKDAPDEHGWYEQPTYNVLPRTRVDIPPTRSRIIEAGLANERLVTGLKQQFDISKHIEKIFVMEGEYHVAFIHDFEKNVTGIVDKDRCFIMELDESTVMSPALLMFSVESGRTFDVSRVLTTLRAALPALHPVPPTLEDTCHDKPVYRLLKEESREVKRSVDGPAHDYIQFAGRHVLEIEIANLADLLQHEQDLTAPAVAA